MKRNIYILGIALTLGLYSCSEDWMSDVVPTDKIEDSQAFNTINDGRNAVNGVFSLMQDEDYYGANYLVYGDLKAADVRTSKLGKRDDEMYLYTETTEASNSTMWTKPYECLASVNTAIENVDKIQTKSDDDILLKKEIQANFYALRALNHFDLLKIYARIPASISGDVANELGVVLANHVISKDETPARANLKESYDFVISDLKKAIELMPASAKTEGWFTVNAVKALLSRVYLFNGDNQLAYDMAKEVIDSGDYSLIANGEYADSWGLNSNSEAILTLINTEEDYAGKEGIGYLWNANGYNTMIITESFKGILYSNSNDDRINAVFEDVKKDADGVPTGEVDYLSNKYPSTTANNAYLIRLSEMYFIAAEAIYKVNASNANTAAGLINTVLKERLNQENVLSTSDIDMDRILLEKRKEFVGEGITFFDLMRNKMDVKRSGSDHLTGAPLTIAYNDFKTIQPIPRIELNVNSNIQQNPQYAK